MTEIDIGLILIRCERARGCFLLFGFTAEAIVAKHSSRDSRNSEVSACEEFSGDCVFKNKSTNRSCEI